MIGRERDKVNKVQAVERIPAMIGRAPKFDWVRSAKRILWTGPGYAAFGGH